jgi:chorismate dehydratase
MAAEPLKVGRIPFLVCAPYFHASLEGFPGVTYIDGPPRALNKLLAGGAVDCAPSSSFEYARNASEYLLIPGLCTSGRGEVKSVLLFSQTPWEELTGKTILLSPDSDTSNALVQVLSRFRFEVAPEFRTADANNSVPVAAKIAIGDAALRETASGRWAHVYDLARVWQEWQGTPLPFGVWILRRDAAARNPQALAAYAAHLRVALHSFFADPSGALDKWEGAFGLPLARGEALDFFSTADYLLTSAHQDALHSFYGFCADLGLLERVPALRWFDEAS